MTLSARDSLRVHDVLENPPAPNAKLLRVARRTPIEDAQIIRLSVDDQQRFAEMLLNAPPLAPAMRRALKTRKRLIADAK